MQNASDDGSTQKHVWTQKMTEDPGNEWLVRIAAFLSSRASVNTCTHGDRPAPVCGNDAAARRLSSPTRAVAGSEVPLAEIASRVPRKVCVNVCVGVCACPWRSCVCVRVRACMCLLSANGRATVKDAQGWKVKRSNEIDQHQLRLLVLTSSAGGRQRPAYPADRDQRASLRHRVGAYTRRAHLCPPMHERALSDCGCGSCVLYC